MKRVLLILVMAVLLVYSVYSQSKSRHTLLHTGNSNFVSIDNANVPQTIIDTIYTENSLQALVSLRMETNEYHAEVLPEFMCYIYPGDFNISGWPTGEPNTNLGFRFYLSFPIQSIPTDYTIESVVFMLYQFYCHGDGGDNHYPLFYGAHYNLMVDHVDYGNSIEITDYYPVTYGTVGAISTNATYGWKQLNVTNEYIQDLNINRQYCQLMIYFPVISDWDFIADCIFFRSSYYPIPEGYPQIVITYQPTNHADDEVSLLSIPRISAFPNPCKDYVTLSTKDNSSTSEIVLYNLKGQRVKSFKTSNNGSKEISLKFDYDIVPGIYLLKYSTVQAGNTNMGTIKLLINK